MEGPYHDGPDGTVLPPECAAITTNAAMDSLRLLLPAALSKGDAEVPLLVQFLTACFHRGLQEPEFVATQIAWLLVDIEATIGSDEETLQ